MGHRPMLLSVVLAAALAAAQPGACPAAETVPLSALDLSKMSAGWGEPQVDRNCIEKPMAIAGKRFDHGVGTHAASALHVRLDGRALRFTAMVGVDDSAGGMGSVRFQVYADGTERFDSGVVKGGQAAKRVEVDLAGAERLLLLVTSAGDDIHHDHADWAEAAFTVAGARPEAVDRPAVDAERVILTPTPGPEPHLNGPAVYGCRPGRPVVRTDEALVLAKPMADGSLAVGLFNLGEVEREMTVTWEQLNAGAPRLAHDLAVQEGPDGALREGSVVLDQPKILGPCRVRDLWRQKDLGEADGQYTATVKRHGVMLVRLWPKE